MATDPMGPIQITAREVYDAVVRLTGRVDVLIEQQTSTMRRVDDQENRIRSLEKARWPLPSAAVLISIATLIITLVVSA